MEQGAKELNAAGPRRRRAVALIIVLSFLVLIAASIVGFFATAGSARRETAGYEQGIFAKQLADMVTNVVMGQISDGTRSWEIPPASPALKGGGARLTYSTQPGLIRTYNDAGTRGRIFKLYSSDTMVTAPGSVWSVSGQLGSEVPANWAGQPAIFTDLNQPVLVEDALGKILPVGSTLRCSAAYPILDPLALLPSAGASAGVQGFDLRGIPGYKGGSGPPVITDSDDPTAGAATGMTSNPAPMPVRWIYVLQDGTLTTPAADPGTTLAADWSSLPAGSPLRPSKTNPIVGRVAFWTDDETCKLNVNTSGEPTPWDTPRAITIQDLKYGQFQPAQKEYQRFPGHPFSMALSPVFFPGVTLTAKQKEDIYRIIPRVGTGGTLAATQAATIAPITLDSDRLYASIDELLFAPPTAGVARRPENPPKDPTGNPSTLPQFKERLKRARFFLTTNSRAPEVTLFGTPRISLWPVPMTAALRTTFDSVAGFCSAVGPGGTAFPFYFQRTDSTKPKPDYDNIPRNQALYKYLQTLTGQPVPGYGGNFKQKWGDDRDQVLTEIFDYIRSTNLRDPVLVQQGNTRFADNGQVAPIQIGNTQGFGRFFTISQAGMHFICSQEADAGILNGNTPPNNKLGTGERIVNASFLFEPWSPSLGFYTVFEKLFFDVQFGASGFTVNGESLKLRAGGKALNNAIGAGWHNNGREHGGSGGLRGPMQAFGGGGYQWLSQAQATLPDGKTKVTGLKVTGDTMNFVGGDVTIKIYSTDSADAGSLVQTLKLRFPDGNFPVPKLVRSGTDAYRGGSSTVTETWWTFGGFTPTGKAAVPGRYSNLGQVPQAPGPEYADPKRRWADSGGAPGFKIGGIFRDEDVVRTIVPDHGDIRLIAAKGTVPATDFVKVRDAEWNSASDRMVHVFTSSAGSHFLYGFANEPGPRPGGADRANPAGGTLGGIPGAAADDQLTASALVKYHYSRLPEIRPGAGKKYNRWNDYDNGVSTWTDGSYINKPDEGNFTSTNSPYTYYAWNTAADSTGTFFSPNRLIPSAGMLGSLPTGVKRNRPWETLLFRPEVRTISGNPHPGTFTPADHLIMDLFWMPVGEPYPISEPFSTAGKVNLNYEIAPFSYIRRATALYGAMKAEEPLVLPNEAATIYKLWDHETNDHPYALPNNPANPVTDATVKSDWTKAYLGQAPFDRMRRAIDVEKTLAQADTRFQAGTAFRSATEVCELHLVRDGETLSDYQSGATFSKALLTGENTRERPYANLYAKLTTKSNTFNVHMRVQVLRKRPGTDTDYAVWNENVDTVVAEHRGSVLIDRYVDASDPNLPDFATKTDATLDNYARFRIVSTSKFAPK